MYSIGFGRENTQNICWACLMGMQMGWEQYDRESDSGTDKNRENGDGWGCRQNYGDADKIVNSAIL